MIGVLPGGVVIGEVDGKLGRGRRVKPAAMYGRGNTPSGAEDDEEKAAGAVVPGLGFGSKSREKG